MTGPYNKFHSIIFLIGFATIIAAVAGSLTLMASVPPGLGQDPSGELVEVSTAFSISAAAPGHTYPAAVIVTIVPGWHINSAQPREDWLIAAKLAFDSINYLTPHSIAYPPAKKALLAGDTMSVYDGQIIVRFALTVAEQTPAGEYPIPVRFTYQPCDNRECRAPQTVTRNLKVTVGANGKPTSSHIFGDAQTTAQRDTTTSQTASAAPESDLQRLIQTHGFWGYFLALGLAFGTGLLLSFSPCTYPMIPITVSIFAGRERSVGRGFIISLFYVGTMAVVYGIMGLVVSLVGGVFGAWLASPAVVIGIGVVFVVFALSMFGLYELQVPSSLRQRLGSAQAGGGIGGAMVLGVVAALVVSPCVGPFVAGILLYVATHGSPVIGFLVLFVFALGLGTLFVIIGTFSSAISRLPGAGEWMETVKKFFGFVLLLMALYFLRTIISPPVIAVLTGLLLVAFGVFGGGLDRLTAETRFFGRLKKFVGILAFLVGVYLLLGSMITQGLVLPPASEWLPQGANSKHESSAPKIRWETDLEAGLARAATEGKPVLIDTWATWCVNCRVLDKKTFGDSEVIAAAERFVPIKIQLETADSPMARDFMTRFGIAHYSLPTTLLLDSSGKVERVLQGIISPDDMVSEMSGIR
jgi:thiol:disulfide interchange protein DsbD